MVVSINSPNNRRRSLAVTNPIPSAASAKMRRRAHSIAPGSSLSPGAKARRSLVPRKSILKSSFTAVNVDPSSQVTQSSGYDETGSWDATTDFSAPVRDNTTRKSMGRRVSFAATSHVRMIEPNKNSSPQSSPTSAPSTSRPPPQLQDENDYPGAKPSRRSSVRYSMAESDMDVTTVFPPATFQTGSAILDEEFDDFDDEDMEEDTMDITQPIRANMARKSSMSAGRQPLAELEVPDSEEELEEEGNSRSTAGEESFQSEAPTEQSQPMEFTIPLGQSLRPPPEEDPAWVALKQIANAGNAEASFEEGDSQESGMGLDDAMERLRRARDSMSLQSPGRMPQDETFTSTEDSFESSQGQDDGNRTMNLTQVMGRASLARSDNFRPSIGYPESNMDESEVYGSAVSPQPPQPPASSTTPSDPTLLPTRPSIFQRPPANLTIEEPAPPPAVVSPTPEPAPVFMAPPSAAFTFTAPPPSTAAVPTATTPATVANAPSKVQAKPTFTAAFAPPVARKSMTSTASPAKRPRAQEEDDLAQATPSKRQAIVSKLAGSAKEVPTPSTSHKVGPLSPSKKARFEAPPAERPSALRQPSGYFSKRKSLAVGFASRPAEDELATPSQGPRKTAPLGLGRASLGSGANDAWARFDKNAPPVNVPAAPSAPATAPPLPITKPTTPSKDKGKEQEAATCLREAARQAMASPSPTRGSPAPQRLPPIPESPLDLAARAPVITINDHPMRDSTSGPAEEDMDQEDDTGPVNVQMEATQQWRDEVAQEDEMVDEDIPSISIAQFFTLTNIKFMDELTAPRKSIHPSQQPTRQARNPADIPLAEYVTAMAIDGPQLDLYSRVSRDLEAWMEKSKEVFQEAEEEASKVTPELFVEYARADEEGQAELMHQLNLIRTHTRYLAKSDWYEWKLKWVEGLRTTADDALRSLEKDALILEELKKSVDDVLPDLEREYEQLQAELEYERGQVEEIEACDQDFLNDLKAEVAEQNIVIEGFKAEFREQRDQLRWLSEKKSELASQKRELKTRIATSQRALNRNQTSTRGEVFRLRDELQSLEELHLFKVLRVDSNLFEYIYASHYQVTIPCSQFKPILPRITITRLPTSKSRIKDDLPRLTNFLFTVAQQMIAQAPKDDPTLSSVRQVMYRLNDFWSSCAQLRTQLTMLGVKYPLEILLPSVAETPAVPRFRAKAKVVFVGSNPSTSDSPDKNTAKPTIMPTKADISFDFSFGAFGKWPMKVDTLECDVDVAYGSIERSAILEAVNNRLRQTSPAESFGCLLEACREAQALALRPQELSY